MASIGAQVFINLIQQAVKSQTKKLWLCLKAGIYYIFRKNNFWSKMMVFLWIVSLKFDQREECFYLTPENVILAFTHREKFSTVLFIVVESSSMNYISLWSAIPKVQPWGTIRYILQTYLSSKNYLLGLNYSPFIISACMSLLVGVPEYLVTLNSSCA